MLKKTALVFLTSLVLFLHPCFAKNFRFGIGIKHSYSSEDYGEWGSSVTALNKNLFFKASPSPHQFNIISKNEFELSKQYSLEMALEYMTPKKIQAEDVVSARNINFYPYINETEEGYSAILTFKNSFYPFPDKKSRISIGIGSGLDYKKAFFDVGTKVTEVNADNNEEKVLAYCDIDADYKGLGGRINVAGSMDYYLGKDFYVSLCGEYIPFGSVTLKITRQEIDEYGQDSHLKETRKFETTGMSSFSLSLQKRL
jgi:hypothetical protein